MSVDVRGLRYHMRRLGGEDASETVAAALRNGVLSRRIPKALMAASKDLMSPKCLLGELDARVPVTTSQDRGSVIKKDGGLAKSDDKRLACPKGCGWVF